MSRIDDNAKRQRLTDYQCRRLACILLEEARLRKKLKGKSLPTVASLDDYVREVATHNVNKTLWVLRNKVGLSRRQALQWLEDRQVQKRSKLKTVYFWQLGTYDTKLVYDAGLADRLILIEAIASYCTRKKASYLWYARQSRRVGLKPRELIELVNRYINRID
jgi:hypothetical protein